MKFCPNCGAQLADDATFCGACGKTMDAAGASTPRVAPVGGTASDSFLNNNKKMLGIIIGAVAAIAVIVILIVCLGGGGYKKPIKQLFKLYNSQCTDAAKFDALTTPDFEREFNDAMLAVLKKTLDKDDFEDYVGDSKERYEDLYDDWEDDYGKKWKITYEIKDADEMKNKDLKDYEEYYEDEADDFDEDDAEDEIESMLDYLDADYKDSDVKKFISAAKKYVKACEKVKVKKGYEVTVKYKIEGKDDKGKGEITFEVVNINGEWLINRTSLSFS